MPRTTASDGLLLIATLATALALGAGLAHAYALPNKMTLSREAYFTVQQIYAGWNRLGFVILVEAGALIGAILVYRHVVPVRNAASVALAAVVGAQAIFWIWTYPANQATQNWTVQPVNWEVLRAQWEYSHLAGASLQIIALLALSIAILRRPP